jgi:hypothetical protein
MSALKFATQAAICLSLVAFCLPCDAQTLAEESATAE